MSNFSYGVYCVWLMVGHGGCRGCAVIWADVKHARNVNNGKVKKEKNFSVLRFQIWIFSFVSLYK